MTVYDVDRQTGNITERNIPRPVTIIMPRNHGRTFAKQQYARYMEREQLRRQLLGMNIRQTNNF